MECGLKDLFSHHFRWPRQLFGVHSSLAVAMKDLSASETRSTQLSATSLYRDLIGSGVKVELGRVVGFDDHLHGLLGRSTRFLCTDAGSLSFPAIRRKLGAALHEFLRLIKNLPGKVEQFAIPSFEREYHSLVAWVC
jgi:hypothetical protein